IVSHESVRQWAMKFGQAFANRIRRRLPCAGGKWHLDEVAVKIAGQKHWVWRAVDQDGIVLDILVQSRRDKRAAKRLLRKLLKKQRRPPRVLITDKLASSVDPSLAGETVTLWWGLFDHELFVEHADQRFGPFGPIDGPIPLHRYRSFRKS